PHGGRGGAEAVLALAVAAGQTTRDAAVTAGVSEKTAYRRSIDPGFRRRVSEMRAAMVERSLGRVADAMVSAADGLKQLLGAQSETVRLAACRTILEMGMKLREN